MMKSTATRARAAPWHRYQLQIPASSPVYFWATRDMKRWLMTRHRLISHLHHRAHRVLRQASSRLRQCLMAAVDPLHIEWNSTLAGISMCTTPRRHRKLIMIRRKWNRCQLSPTRKSIHHIVVLARRLWAQKTSHDFPYAVPWLIVIHAVCHRSFVIT